MTKTTNSGSVSSSSSSEAPALLIIEPSNALEQPPSQIITPRREENPPPAVPVTILTGFLGSGKSTLIQNILSTPSLPYRIAIIENEFGDSKGNTSSVESLIVRDYGKNPPIDNNASLPLLADLVELPNGCICCTVKDSLVQTLEMLVQKRNDLDYILIECSGMANPGPVASVFWLDEELNSRLRLDGIVCMVDSRNLESDMMQDGGLIVEAERQIAFADKIIVNKVDLVEEGKINNVVEIVRGINPSVEIQMTSFGKLDDLGWILGANCFDMERLIGVEDAFTRVMLDGKDNHGGPVHASTCSNTFCKSCCNIEEGLGTTLTCTEISTNEKDSVSQPVAASKLFDHEHTFSVGTITLIRSGSVILPLVHAWIAAILWPDQDKQDKDLRWMLEDDFDPSSEQQSKRDQHNFKNSSSKRQMQIFRMKGILSIQHKDQLVKGDDSWDDDVVDPNNGLDSRRFILQSVNDLWEIQPASNDALRWTELEPLEIRCCKIVVIGRWLNREDLQSGFNACFAESALDGAAIGIAEKN